MASGSDSLADSQVRRLNGVDRVNQAADFRRVVEGQDDLVPDTPPARCDHPMPLGQIAFLELNQSQFCSIGLHRRVPRLADSLGSSGDGLAVLVAGDVHGHAQQVDDAGFGCRSGGQRRLDGLRKGLSPSTAAMRMSWTAQLRRLLRTSPPD
jgi:hypothetical protein